MLETIKGNCAIKEIFEKNWGLFCAKRKNIRPAVKENVEKILKERFKYYLVLYLRDWAKKKVRLIIPNIIKNIWKKK